MSDVDDENVEEPHDAGKLEDEAWEEFERRIAQRKEDEALLKRES